MKLSPRILAVFVLATFNTLRADTVIVFNEVMYHPATNETALEWVEFHNQMAVDVDISGWSVTGGIDYTFPSNTVMQGGSYLVLAIDPAALAAATGLAAADLHGPFLGRLSNNSDTLRLRDNSRRVRDELTYDSEGDWPVPPDGSGVSLAKHDPQRGTAQARHWTWSAQMGGTPGAVNFPGAPPNVALLEVDDVWSYEDSGTDLGSAWRESSYNDDAWNTRQNVESAAVTSLYPTGLSNNRTALADGAADPHYVITAAAQGTVGANATVILNHPNWAANDAQSKWIGVVNPGSTSIQPGNYNFRTAFSLDGFIPSTVKVDLSVAVDNDVSDVLVNGQSTGLSFSGFAGLSGTSSLQSGFQSGQNTLEFLTINQPPNANPGGVRVLADGTGLRSSTGNPLADGTGTYYFRKEFAFSGDTSLTTLQLQSLVADGAVFYLNGTEIHRVNMPAGPIGFSTPALQVVAAPELSQFVPVSAANLVEGNNVLAVELHLASGSASDPLLGVNLTSSTGLAPASAGRIALNEVAGSTNETFFVELVNHGDESFDLSGYVVVRDGETNQSYVVPGGTTLAAGAYLVWTETQLGFDADSGDRLLLMQPNLRGAADGVVVKSRLRGRSPDGTGAWLYPDAATPNTANSFQFRDEIVINEIMYHHIPLPSDGNPPVVESNEAWVELHNRGNATVDLTGWRIDDGVRFDFAPGTTIAPGGYLVVAEDVQDMRTRHPGIVVVGNFNGNLSGKSDRLVLLDAWDNPADVVEYHDTGRWPDYADGGGSSLELRDPDADNAKAEAWAASDETGKTSWQSYSYRKVAAFPSGTQPTQWNDFVFGLLAEGECLIDDIRVVENPDGTPVELVANGNFSSGLAGWRVLGTHGRSHVIGDPDNPGNQVLRVVATGAQEHMHNHIEATTIGNRAIVNGREYEISFRARWLAGNNLLNTRLYFNRSAESTRLPVATNNGTPGAPNSRLESNIGPTFEGLSHAPVIPQPGQPVTVRVQAADPQGVATCTLWWSVNGGAWSNTAMAQQAGAFSADIPGGNAGDIVQFYVAATDTPGATAAFPAAGPDSGALYMVDDGQANLELAHNFRIILSPANRDLLHAFTNVQSNAKLPGTVVWDEQRAYYNAGIRLKGSERGRYNDTRVSFHVTFQPDDLFRDVHPVMLVDRSGAGDSTANKQQEILIKHMLLRAGGIPGTQSDMIRVIAPFNRHTESAMLFPRHEDEYVETAFEDGGDGQMYELELIYYPTTANAFGYKNPNPDSVNTAVDIMDMGDDKELYRYNFIKKNNRYEDDYSDFINVAKAWSRPNEELDAVAPLVMDVDQWMRAWALVTLSGVGDSYTFGNNHNLLMYFRPDDGRMIAFPWDMDFSFNRAATSGLIGDRNLSRIIARRPFLRLFYAHVQEIIESVYHTDYMNYWIDHYDNFAPGQNYAAVAGYINTRRTTALNAINSAGGNAAFAVDPLPPMTLSNNLAILTGTAPVRVKTILINGVAYPVTWLTLAAWRIELPLDPGINELEIVGLDVHDQPVPGTTNEVSIVYEGPVALAEENVVINEIMYHPTAERASFVELFNRSPDVSFNLSGWRVNGLSFTFPPGSFITNGQYLVLAEDPSAFLDAYGIAGGTPFAQFDGMLDLDGETLSLQKPVTVVVTNQMDMVETNIVYVDAHKVRYEARPPWPIPPSGSGRSLQLIDAAEDAARVSNWSGDDDWRYYEVTAPFGSFSFSGTNLTFFLSLAGEVLIDDVTFEEGSVAGAGVNLIENPGFESGDLGPWEAAGSHVNSFVTSELAHGGNHALHMVSTGSGTFFANVRQNMAADAVESTKTYTLSFYYRSVTSGALNYFLSLTYRTGSPLADPIDVTPQLVSPGAANGAVANLPPYDPVWLNELQSDNTGQILDASGQGDPWVELYNAGPTVISLDGYFLSDNYDSNLTQWPFPSGTSLAPGEFKIVWLDGQPGQSTAGELHANFRLATGTGSLALNRLVGVAPQITDYLNYDNLAPGQSYGSTPDGDPFRRAVFLEVTPGAPNVARPADVFINEWMSDNSATLTDPADGGFEDWFELYNAGEEPVDLTGYFLTDDFDDKTQFEIPAGYVIEPGGFLLVWADNEAEQNTTNSNQLHVNFALSRDGERLGLYSPDRIALDEITFGGQTNDVSHGRFPDGSVSVVLMSVPTPGSANTIGGANTPPVLVPITDRVIALGQTLSFTVTASDAEVPPQILNFTLLPGAPEGASINPFTGQFVWTPTALQAPAQHTVTVRVTDNGSPSLSDEATFTVTVESTPGIMITPGDGQVSLSFPATVGRTYRFHYADDLDVPIDWQPLGPDIVADGDSVSIDDPIGARVQRFYQVEELPQ